MDKYNPVEYWSERELPNKYDTLQDWDLKVLKPLTDESNTILDYGVGTGRLMPLYEGKVVWGVDIVDTYLKTCKEKAKEHNVDFMWSKHIWGNYDLGVISKVLLHMEEPETIINEMVSKCEKVFISTGINLNASHCFNHDYENILSDYDILHWELTDNDLTIVIQKSKPCE